MYVEKLHIKNFRCFDDTEFELNYPGRKATAERAVPTRLGNVNLFLGGNGTGKTSVFKALSVGILAPILPFSGFPADYLVRRRPGEISNGSRTLGVTEHRATITVDLYLGKLDYVSSVSHERTRIATQVYQDRDIQSIRTALPSRDALSASNVDEDDPGFRKDQWEEIYQNTSPGFFLVGYGANRRAARPDGYSEGGRKERYRRVASLFEDQFGLVPFIYGYLQLKDAGYLDEARTILNDLLPGEVTLTDQQDSENEPLFDCDDIFVPFNALSDGFRVFIGWVWDMLFQMSRLKTTDGLRLKLTEIPGVVIVDEIDLLLHPEWQRIVIDLVAIAFPRIQFLFSTHSPLVAGALKPENIYVMDDHKVEQYQEDIYGLTASQVLGSSYFGLASTRAPGTGTLTDLAKQMLGQTNGTAHTEEANPKDRALLAREKALRMLAEIGDE